jgi:ABC-2 type transport system permease protein
VIGSLRAEWTKARTMPSTVWLVLGAVVVTAAIGAAVTAAVNVRECPTPSTCFEDTPLLSLTGVRAGQVLVLVFAVLAMSNEYGTGMMPTTLTAIPSRLAVLFGKVGVVTGITLGAAAAGVLAAILVGRNVLPGNGFTPANGYPPLSLGDGTTLRAAGGSVLYLGLIAILSLGVAAIVRDTAGAITTVLVLLFLAPAVLTFVSNPVWHHRLQRYTPMNAGLTIQATRDLAALPITPWGGLGVLAAYAGGALLLGALALCLRDA